MVSSLYPPETIGGAEKYVRNLSERLVRDGHEVDVVTTGSYNGVGEGTTEVSGVEIHRISPLGFYTPYEHHEAPSWQKPFQHILERWNPDVYAEFGSIIQEKRPDIVHTHNFGGLSTAIFTAANRHDVPIVHTLHDYRLLDLRYTLWKDGTHLGVRNWMAPLRWFHQITVDRPVDRVLSPSQFMLDLHHEYGLFDDTPCTLLPYGIEHGSADHTLVVDETSSKDTSQELRLLFVGQLTAQKGALWLVNAIDMMNRTDVRLDVLGKGPQMEEIKKIAAESEVIHVHGFVTGSDLDEFYKLADATVVSSKWYDNSPMVIYESYFQGTPVIGANIGGIPELIEEGRTGFLFNPNDQNSLQNAIESAIKTDNGKLRKGVEEVRKRYTMDKHFTELLSEYEATIN